MRGPVRAFGRRHDPGVGKPERSPGFVLNAYFVGASADGTHVFFTTDENVTNDDTDQQGNFDIFERFNGETTLLSTGPADRLTYRSDPTFLAASPDGARVLFEWYEPLVPEDPDDFPLDIYERSAGVTRLLSVGSSGQNGPAHAVFAGASDDLSRAFFTSTDQLAPGDGDAAADVFERVSGTTALLASGAAQPRSRDFPGKGPTPPCERRTRCCRPTRTHLPTCTCFGAPVGFVRPKSAYLVWAPLVPAHSACSAPNRAHGPPLDSGSCAPPQRSAAQLTIGTPDVNGQPTKSVGSVRVRAVPGNPATPADEADARIVLDLTDVRVAADLSDYAGQLDVRLGMRITDKLGGVAATVADSTLSAPAQCAPTPDPAIGGHCTLITTADALAPGTVLKGKRTVWELGAVQVYHGTTPYAVQGVFVP